MLKVLLLLAFVAVALAALGTRSDPHIVPNGSHIDRNDTHLIFTHPDGSESHILRNKVSPGQKRLATGWEASLWTWDFSSSTSFSYFSGTWTVPPTPSVTSGQILFFFNSLQGEIGGNPGSSGNDILQPVLQYNNGVAGWTLASWYGASTYTESTPVACNPGDTIQGVIELSGGTWYVLGYINGVLKTELTVAQSAFNNGDPQNTAQWVLEVPTISECSQLPSSNSATINNIVLQESGTTVTGSWGNSVGNGACGATGVVNSETSLTVKWNSGTGCAGGQSTGGCGSGTLYCANAGGTGQCYNPSSYSCSCSSPYLCPSTAPYACNGGCYSSSSSAC